MSTYTQLHKNKFYNDESTDSLKTQLAKLNKKKKRNTNLRYSFAISTDSITASSNTNLHVSMRVNVIKYVIN